MTTKSQLPRNSCFAHDDGIQVYWAKGDTCPLCLAYEADDLSQPQQESNLQRVYLNPTDIGVTRRWYDKQHVGMGEVAYVREQNQVEAQGDPLHSTSTVPEANTLTLAEATAECERLRGQLWLKQKEAIQTVKDIRDEWERTGRKHWWPQVADEIVAELRRRMEREQS